MAAIPSFNPNAAALVYLLIVLAVWVRRVFWIRRFRKFNPPLHARQRSGGAEEKITVIVPARDEEKNIANCLFHLFKQNHSDFEIVVVDDRSRDRTPHLLENFKALSPVPFKVIRIEKLPPGWTGKKHAMFAGSKTASGDWLLFTDADTTHGTSSLRTALACAKENRIDFLTLAPETECRTFWEKTVQPLAVSSLALWFDLSDVNASGSKKALANGQYILVKKNVYEAIGGNESVQSEVVEDVELAKKAKHAGFNVKFLNGTELYSTRMYSSLKEIQKGWTRIFTYLSNKDVSLILHKIFLILFFSILPFVLAALEIAWWCAHSAWVDKKVLAVSLVACATIVLIRSVGNRLLKCDPKYALLHPLGSLVMVGILSACLGRIWFNRPSVWRGDSYR